MKYKSYSLSNFLNIPQIKNLRYNLIDDIENVGSVLPFKTNNYVTERLFDWTKVPDDPIFILTFPQKGMLIPEHYELISDIRKKTNNKNEIKAVTDSIRMKLNPHPAGQV